MYATRRVTVAIERLKGAFLEYPDLRMTPDDAVAWAAVECSTTRSILEALSDVGFLQREPHDVFSRPLDQRTPSLEYFA
jgi:hypothetical protein